jgi:mismatch-specific thymine-DNA glycosylase
MAKTRSTNNIAKSEPKDKFQTKMERDDNLVEIKAEDEAADVPPAFKTAMSRFRHNEVKENKNENHNNYERKTRSHNKITKKEEPSPKLPDYKITRKRPLDPSLVSQPSPSPSPAKRSRRQPSKYAPPSKYAHLPTLLDVLEPNLICIFVGTNPGIRTATSGHAYAHPSNQFWKLLASSGCTEHERLRPEQDVDLPRLYSMGNTNIVARPSRDAAELSKAEMAEGTPVLEAKIREFRPEAVCIVGKGIWEAVWRWWYKRAMRKGEFRYGWQEERMGGCEGWEGARIFVATSTSGLSASTKPAEKEAIWRPFGEWVQMRRRERAGDGDGDVEGEET